MVQRNFCPEFADTAGHKIGVAVQVGSRFQHAHPPFLFGREQRQIHLHPLRQGEDQGTDMGLVVRVERVQTREALSEA